MTLTSCVSRDSTAATAVRGRASGRSTWWRRAARRRLTVNSNRPLTPSGPRRGTSAVTACAVTPNWVSVTPSSGRDVS